jgi:uncharacterized membrane protein YkvA (DUF1232 family)
MADQEKQLPALRKRRRSGFTLPKIVVILISVIYVILPTDAIPDFIPFVGWVDDLVVGAIGILTAIAAVTGQLRRSSGTRSGTTG